MFNKIRKLIATFVDNNIKGIPDPPYSYSFLCELKEQDYPVYLRKIFMQKMNRFLDIRNPKTLSEKIQWLKLYDSNQLKTQLTDKLLVRNFIKDKLGADYLKPILQICNNFDDINWKELPDTFIIKCNHGCKWQIIIKNKTIFLNNKIAYDIVKNKFNDWMNVKFTFFSGFEKQYSDIHPQILIEPILISDGMKYPIDIEVYCFNGKVKYITKRINKESYCWNEKFEKPDVYISNAPVKKFEKADNFIQEAFVLSEKVANDFKLVRVDWLLYGQKLYFNEMTFTPRSGFYSFLDEKEDLLLGSKLKIK